MKTTHRSIESEIYCREENCVADKNELFDFLVDEDKIGIAARVKWEPIRSIAKHFGETRP